MKRIGLRNYFDKNTQTARQSGPFYGQNLSNGVPICHKHPQKRGTERSKLLSLATESFPNPMNPGKTLLLLQFLLCAATAAAQSAEVRFRVADRATREAVVGAVAELRSRTDTAAAPLYTTSDIDGRGTFPRVPHGDYRLTVTSLGYDSLRRDLRVGLQGLVRRRRRIADLEDARTGGRRRRHRSPRAHRAAGLRRRTRVLRQRRDVGHPQHSGRHDREHRHLQLAERPVGVHGRRHRRRAHVAQHRDASRQAAGRLRPPWRPPARR